MNKPNKLRVPVTKADHTQGPEDAPLELVEYGDYECPFCGRAYYVIKRLQEELKDNLRFVFRNFPLAQMHPHAMNAAKAAEAAGLQAQFWQMHDLLYENQNALDDESLSSYAATLELDLDQFAKDMDSAEVRKRILRDFEGGARSGVNGTPTFFINGYRYDGDWSFESLYAVLASVLERKVA